MEGEEVAEVVEDPVVEMTDGLKRRIGAERRDGGNWVRVEW